MVNDEMVGGLQRNINFEPTVDEQEYIFVIYEGYGKETMHGVTWSGVLRHCIDGAYSTLQYDTPQKAERGARTARASELSLGRKFMHG